MGNDVARPITEWMNAYDRPDFESLHSDHPAYKDAPEMYSIRLLLGRIEATETKFRNIQAEVRGVAGNLTDGCKEEFLDLLQEINSAYELFERIHKVPFASFPPTFTSYGDCWRGVRANVTMGLHPGDRTQAFPDAKFGLVQGNSQYADDEKYRMYYDKFFSNVRAKGGKIVAKDAKIRNGPPVIFNGNGTVYIPNNTGRIGDISTRVTVRK